MPRKSRIGARKGSSPRRVAYKMVNGKEFYEKTTRTFPYGVMPYFQNFYITNGYVADE